MNNTFSLVDLSNLADIQAFIKLILACSDMSKTLLNSMSYMGIGLDFGTVNGPQHAVVFRISFFPRLPENLPLYSPNNIFHCNYGNVEKEQLFKITKKLTYLQHDLIKYKDFANSERAYIGWLALVGCVFGVMAFVIAMGLPVRK